MHLPTEMLLPHTPSFFNHNALNFDYEPYAPEPRQWLDFLNQLWGDDPQAIDTLQEIFGYLPDRRHEPAKSVRGDRPETQRQGHHRAGARSRTYRGPQLRRADASRPQHELRTRAADRQARRHHIRRAAFSRRVDQHAIAERLLSITGEDAITIDRKYKRRGRGNCRPAF